MSHIFISHSTKDGAREALQLVAELEATGRRCWISPRDMKAGADYPTQIVGAIRACQGLVLLLTPGANESADVLQEVQSAHKQGKLIVPLVIRGTQPSDGLDYFLGVRQQTVWTDSQAVAVAVAEVFTSEGGHSRQSSDDSDAEGLGQAKAADQQREEQAPEAGRPREREPKAMEANASAARQSEHQRQTAGVQQAKQGFRGAVRPAVTSRPFVLIAGAVGAVLTILLLLQLPRYIQVGQAETSGYAKSHGSMARPKEQRPKPSASVPAQDCDRLAQPPNIGSGYPRVYGVTFEKIDGNAAQEACERALREFPGEVRFKAYLGRALERLNRLEEASVMYRQAAENGDASAQVNLGLLYALGHGVTQSYVEAQKWYRLAADQGYAPGQFNLGTLYADGDGVSQSYTEVLKWYRLAADQGYARAQTNLGFMYQHGRGVAQSDTEAVKWYLQAAAQGDSAGEADLGAMYEHGFGVTQDYTEALKWFRLAADQGDGIGQANLGAMYVSGLGVKQNDTEAVKWFRLAADQGNSLGQANLGAMYASGRGVQQNYTEALKWFRLAADQGNPLGQVDLGVMYENGSGVKQNYKEAVKWYRLAADQGDAYGQRYLGSMYEYGYGVLHNNAEAVKWYRLAAKQGDRDAQTTLQRLGEAVP
jgi:TPR repeat protein